MSDACPRQTRTRPTCREAVLNCVAHYDDGEGTPRWKVFRTAYTFDTDDLAWAIDTLLLTGGLDRRGTGALTLTERTNSYAK